MADDSSEIVKEQSESVAATNLKVLGDGPAFHTNLVMANAVSNQQAMNQIQAAITSKAAEALLATDPREAGGDIAAMQALAKMVQTIPPTTAGT